MRVQLPFLSITLIILASCSASYHQINPHYNSYESSTKDKVELKYKYGILEKSGNKRYNKRAHSNDIELIAIELINNSEETIYLDKNYGIFSDDKQLHLLSPNETITKLKQGVFGHIFYLLLTPLKLTITDSKGIADVYPVGYIIGPALTLLNMTGAASANKKFRLELEQYNLLHKPILPGKREKGIIAIESGEQLPLSLKKMDN